MNNSPDKKENLSASKQVLLALKEAKNRIEALEYTKTEPIAVVGMACRFPGGADSPQKLWQLLSDGVDAIREIPPKRWNVDNYYDPNPETPGKMYTRSGGFLQEDIDQFDPLFFSISEREAISIDPQHRLLLEVSWEALENAGYIPHRLHNSLTGVFVGITNCEYQVITGQARESNVAPYRITGLPLNAAAGRLSYTLGLTGPSMAIDTACSSSLVAIHQACQSLRSQECHMALAGGVNLWLLPEPL
ncbi:MAG: polyketide synthase, partial [Moorea sp. SIO4A1]|uniref:polyketide synthase n=1 Tax=Moorena sp. SIO4A1 TaxID=2607835 RepID=UPI001450DAEE